MLLARVRPTRSATATGVLRGVFEPGDAWLETGDLFVVDADGDFWLVDHAPAVIRAATGVVSVGADPGRARRRRLGRRSPSPTASGASDGAEVPCAAVTLREGHELDIHEVERRSPTSATAASPGSSGSSTGSR